MTLVIGIERPDGGEGVLLAADSCVTEAQGDIWSVTDEAKIVSGYGDTGRPSRITYLVGCAGAMRTLNVIRDLLLGPDRPTTHSQEYALFSRNSEAATLQSERAWVAQRFIPALTAALKERHAFVEDAENGRYVPGLHLIVAVGSTVWMVEPDLSLSRSVRGYEAIGSSAAICVAHGVMAASRRRKALPRAQLCIKTAAGVSNEVREPCRWAWLHPA